MSIEFLLTTLVIVACPGTGAIYTVAAGLSGGIRQSMIAAFGCTLGIIPHMIAAISGLAALLHTSAAAFQAIKWMGVAYLLYMAWTMVRENGVLRIDGAPTAKNSREVVTSAILINLLNPKLSIFFLAFLPQFVTAGTSDPILLMLKLSLVFMALTFVIFTGYGIFAAYLRGRIVGNPEVQRWLRRGFAAAFLVVALQLAYTAK